MPISFISCSAGRLEPKSVKGDEMRLPPPEIKFFSLSLPVSDRRWDDLNSSVEKFSGVPQEKQSAAEDTRIRSDGDSDRENFSREGCSNLLGQLIVKAGIASNKRRAAKLLDVNSMLKKNNYKILVALGLLNCPRKLSYAILDTGPEMNNITLDAMDPSRTVAVMDVKP